MVMPSTILEINSPATADLVVVPGNTLQHTFVFQDASNVAINLGADTTGQAQIRTSSGGSLLATATVSTTPATGTVVVTFSPASTAVLTAIESTRDDEPQVKAGLWDLLLSDGAGNKITPFSGTVYLVPRITT